MFYTEKLKRLHMINSSGVQLYNRNICKCVFVIPDLKNPVVALVKRYCLY